MYMYIAPTYASALRLDRGVVQISHVKNKNQLPENQRENETQEVLRLRWVVARLRKLGRRRNEWVRVTFLEPLGLQL